MYRTSSRCQTLYGMVGTTTARDLPTDRLRRTSPDRSRVPTPGSRDPAEASRDRNRKSGDQARFQRRRYVPYTTPLPTLKLPGQIINTDADRINEIAETRVNSRRIILASSRRPKRHRRFQRVVRPRHRMGTDPMARRPAGWAVLSSGQVTTKQWFPSIGTSTGEVDPTRR